MRLAFSCLVTLALAVFGASCSSRSGDPPADGGIPAPSGKALRIRDLTDPALDGHAERVATTQTVSGAIVIAVDTFDETKDGKGVGNIFVQDIDAKDPDTTKAAPDDKPYSGIGLFAPSFNPGNLRVSPGDVLDMRGEYQENTQIPSNPPVKFAPGAVLSQLALPIATFRYETHVPEPVVVTLADLTDFKNAQKWLGMLVRVKDIIKVPKTSEMRVATSGRASIDLTPTAADAPRACEAPFPKAVQLVNDLVDLDPFALKPESTIKSLTGVLGFFCNVKIAPRSPADIQL